MAENDDPARRLEIAVRKLTEPHTSEHWQRTKRGRTLVTLTHAPLIWQLENGLTSTGASYGGSAPQSRNVLDTDTLTKLTDLSTVIARSWANLLPGAARAIPLHKIPRAEALREWHRLFAEYNRHELVPPGRLTFEARTYTGWVSVILTKFDPPTQIEGTTPCPKCNARWTEPDDLEDRVSALVYVFPGSVDQAHASCRVCGENWRGPLEMHALKRQLTNPRHAEQSEPNPIDPEIVIH